MSGREKTAVITLFDNSVTSLDGDYAPNRLDAQKDAVEEISRIFLRRNPESMFGLGTLAMPNYGIVTAITNDKRRIRAGIDSISRGTVVALEKSIRCAMFALRHKPAVLTEKKIIVILGSHHDLTPATKDELVTFTNKEGASVDIVLFGNDHFEIELLEDYCKSLIKPSQLFQINEICNLRQAIQKIFTATTASGQPIIEEPMENDPQLEEILRISREEAGLTDNDLQAVLQESLRHSETQEAPAPPPQNSIPQTYDEVDDIDEGDEALQEALRLSMLANQPSQSEAPPSQPTQNEADEDDLENDPEFLAALSASQQVNETNEENAGEAAPTDTQVNEDENLDLEDEDEELREALAMSLSINQDAQARQQQQPAPPAQAPAPPPQQPQQPLDPIAALQQVLNPHGDPGLFERTRLELERGGEHIRNPIEFITQLLQREEEELYDHAIELPKETPKPKPEDDPKKEEEIKNRNKKISEDVQKLLNDRNALAEILAEYGISIDDFGKQSSNKKE